MTLPEKVPGQIYELVIWQHSSLQSPTYWLETSGTLRSSRDDYGPLPTLENKDSNWGSYYYVLFCRVQGFAQELYLHAEDGLQVAHDVLKDYLCFFGSRTVIELTHIECNVLMEKAGSTSCNWSKCLFILSIITDSDNFGRNLLSG
jgi:hypothetical protein